MNNAQFFLTLVGISVILAACGQGATPLPTVAPPPHTTTPLPTPSSTPSTSVTPSPPSALAPPGGVTQPVPISPTGSEGYSQPSLASIIESYRSSLTSTATMILLEAVQPEPIPIEYTSQTRPLAPETKGFLWQFGESFGQESFPAKFEYELLLREGNQEYWMPVQEPLLDFLANELAAGQTATIYVRLLGSLQTEQGDRMIFIITDIKK